MSWLVVALAGGTGAVLRYLTDRLIPPSALAGFPWGTLAVNILGSFVLGVLVGARVGEGTMTVVGTGLLGGFTTFSTASLATVRLLEDGKWMRAFLSSFGMLAAALLAACAGIVLAGIW